MLVSIFIGVLSLLVLVAAFFGSKYWHWAHVTILVLFYFSGVGYAVLTAQSLSIRTKFQKQERRSLDDLAKQQQGIDALLHGTDQRQVLSRLASGGALIGEEANTIEGIRELRLQLDTRNHERGRAWRNARPTSAPDADTGRVAVFFPATQPEPIEEGQPEEEAPEAEIPPLGLRPDSVVSLFEQGSHDGNARQYLGEFRVIEVSGREAMLDPLNQLRVDSVAADRFFDSQGPWIVYESMPTDKSELFAGLDEEQLRALLPPESLEEYLRDGTAGQPDDDPFRLEGLDADGNPLGVDAQDEAASYRYRRLPRDYAFLLKDYDKEFAELLALVQATTTDLEKLDTALAGAEALRDHREKELSRLESDLTLARRDRSTIEKHLDTLRQQHAKAERLLRETLEQNAALVAQRSHARGNLIPVATGALDIDAL